MEQYFVQYGPWALVAFLLLTNPTAQNLLKSLISPLAPQLSARWKAQQARDEREWEQAQRDRADAVVIAKDMVMAYRQELNDAKIERKAEQGRQFDLLQQYERNMAAYIDVMRDLTDLVRMSSQRISEVHAKVVKDKDEPFARAG